MPKKKPKDKKRQDAASSSHSRDLWVEWMQLLPTSSLNKQQDQHTFFEDEASEHDERGADKPQRGGEPFRNMMITKLRKHIADDRSLINDLACQA
jgi:hypothetical protein